MKTNKLPLLLVLAELLATQCSLDAHPVRLWESGANYPYVPNALALDQNAQEENSFFNTDSEVEAQEKAVTAAYIKTLENKVNVEDKKITNLKKQLTTTNNDVEQIKKEHAQLKKNNVEKPNK